MSKIPKHLQGKINDEASSYEFSVGSVGYKAGAAAMHALMLEELKPILKITDRALRQWKMYCEEGMQDDLENADRENIEAQELMNDLNNLAYFKERIEAQNDPT